MSSVFFLFSPFNYQRVPELSVEPAALFLSLILMTCWCHQPGIEILPETFAPGKSFR
jgi:hypothetical protein